MLNVASLFQLLYNQLAWTYDTVSYLVSFGEWQAWVAAGLPYLPGPRVLELGHGPGHLLALLGARGYDAVGIDPSRQMSRLAQRRMAALGASAKLVLGRAQSLPFPASTFDGVVSTFPTPYILAPETIAAVHRVLRPRGRLVIVPEAQLTGSGLLVRGVEWLYVITGQRQRGYSDSLWKQALTGQGFEVVHQLVKLGNSVVTVVVAERLSNS